ncbi:MAG: hypothetical protein JWO07_307 [Candidatus Saccharibacteria bacterium]|nr:hypothetical protein [Candidatus Saccharibacteria bacterium]
MGRFIVAVSGGVDSVVLLDKLSQEHAKDALIVAHFDHGIRPDSAADAEFVRGLAEKYGLAFETKREELGPDASEELARNRRYEFLRTVAKKYEAVIVTAHHADDVIETIAINLIRGTGWRGLAVLGSPDIDRPLLAMTKGEIIEYARQNTLEWHEDSTNQNTKYLRNDVRQKLVGLDADTKELLRLYRQRQVALKQMIDAETATYMQTDQHSRYLLTHVPDAVACELLRAILIKETGQGLTRPQLERMLLAVKTYPSGKVYDVDSSHILQFTCTNFVVATRAEVVS